MKAFVAALALLAAGCAASPAGSTGARRESGEALHARGLGLLASGRTADAERALSQAIAADAGLARAYWDRGRARLKLGDAAGARQDLDRWLEYDPKYALVRAERDLFLFEDGREARRDAEEAAGKRAEEEGSPLAAFRRYALAYALSEEGQAEDRLADALIRTWKAATPRPDYPPGLKRMLAQAEACARDRRHEEAAVLYRQAARFCPWCAQAHYNAAMILGEYRQYAEAAKTLKRAVALLPEGPEVQEAQGALFTWETLQ